MNEKIHSQQTSLEQFDEFYVTHNPFETLHAIGLGAISTIDLIDKINMDLEKNKVIMAASNEPSKPPKERTAIEKLRLAQGRKPGESVSVPIPEPSSNVRAVRKPVRITRRAPGKNR